VSRLVEADLGRLFGPRDVTDGVVHLTIIEDQKRSKVAARQIIFETESYPPILCVPGGGASSQPEHRLAMMWSMECRSGALARDRFRINS